MSLITTKIPQQNYEIILGVLATILKVELTSQIALNDDDEDTQNILKNTTVWKERFIPPQEDEQFVVIPLLFSAEYQKQNVNHADAQNTFYIDFYGKARAGDETNSDEFSAVRLQRLVGIARAIIEDVNYLTLGIAPPFISHREVSDIRRVEVDTITEGGHVTMYRMTVRVRAFESTAPIQPIQLDQSLTSVEVNGTDRGFEYVWVKT